MRHVPCGSARDRRGDRHCRLVDGRRVRRVQGRTEVQGLAGAPPAAAARARPSLADQLERLRLVPRQPSLTRTLSSTEELWAAALACSPLSLSRPPETPSSLRSPVGVVEPCALSLPQPPSDWWDGVESSPDGWSPPVDHKAQQFKRAWPVDDEPTAQDAAEDSAVAAEVATAAVAGALARDDAAHDGAAAGGTSF
eukprot:5057043-Prymnesium_polylepis.1